MRIPHRLGGVAEVGLASTSDVSMTNARGETGRDRRGTAPIRSENEAANEGRDRHVGTTLSRIQRLVALRASRLLPHL